jgi:hypothetical protein
MPTFYRVTLIVLLLGWAVLAFFVPWTSTPVGSPDAHNSLGYAALWSHQFASTPGARVDLGALLVLGGVVAFFAIVIGASAYFFRNKRGPEREDV